MCYISSLQGLIILFLSQEKKLKRKGERERKNERKKKKLRKTEERLNVVRSCEKRGVILNNYLPHPVNN